MFSLRFSSLVLIVSSLVYYFVIYSPKEEVILNTKYGTLKGFKSTSRDGRPFNSFRKIPYGKPPIGSLRFQPPQPAEKWEGIRDATIETPVCTQVDSLWRKIVGQEDCLFLNVYTPKIPKNPSDPSLPVMLFLHGGYYMFGSGTDLYDPMYFMDENVVIVTINYRLGAMGFLSTNDEVVPGNMGLKDQTMALRWVQENIRHFGGDPGAITIFGESAGAGSVHLHTMSSMSSGLIQRGISQSGNSLCPWTNLHKDTKAQAKRLGERVNCPTESSEALVECLRSKDALTIVETQRDILETFYNPHIDIYGPTVENVKDKSKAFLTTSTLKLYEEGKVANKVPWLSGINSEEGAWKSAPIFSDEEKLLKFHTQWKEIIPNSLIFQDKPEIAEKIRNYYFGHNNPFTIKDYPKAIAMFSDRYFSTCLGETARLHAKHAPTFLYYFSHKNPASTTGFLFAEIKGKYNVWLELIFGKIKEFVYPNLFGWEVLEHGTSHADELGYLFYTGIPTTGIFQSSKHYQFSKAMVKLWVSFARNGYPSKFEGKEWTEVQKNQPPRYMHIGEPAGMIDEPFTASMRFWQSLKLTPR